MIVTWQEMILNAFCQVIVIDAFVPWETEAHAKMNSLENLLCNCDCNLAGNKLFKNLFWMFFADDGTWWKARPPEKQKKNAPPPLCARLPSPLTPPTSSSDKTPPSLFFNKTDAPGPSARMPSPFPCPRDRKIKKTIRKVVWCCFVLTSRRPTTE